MPRWTALLFFPVAPTLAARWLQASRAACVLPLPFAIAVASLFRVAGVETEDALAIAATFLWYAYGLAIGGTLFGLLATRVVGRDAAWKEIVGPSCAAAAWSPFVFITLLGLAHFAGAGGASALYAGLLLLFWGIASGMGIVGGDESTEPGRLLVATCLGLCGCLLGLLVSHQAQPPVLVPPLRSPFDAQNIRRGNLLLVRSDRAPEAPALVLLRERGTREAVFAYLDQNGTRTPLGKVSIKRKMLQDWNIVGRVFFRFGGRNRWGVVGTEQIPQLSHN